MSCAVTFCVVDRSLVRSAEGKLLLLDVDVVVWEEIVSVLGARPPPQKKIPISDLDKILVEKGGGGFGGGGGTVLLQSRPQTSHFTSSFIDSSRRFPQSSQNWIPMVFWLILSTDRPPFGYKFDFFWVRSPPI